MLTIKSRKEVDNTQGTIYEELDSLGVVSAEMVFHQPREVRGYIGKCQGFALIDFRDNPSTYIVRWFPCEDESMLGEVVPQTSREFSDMEPEKADRICQLMRVMFPLHGDNFRYNPRSAE